MKKLKIFIFTFLVFLFSPNIYANDSSVFNDGKSIKDLRKNIDNLNKAEFDLDIKFKNFLKEYKFDIFLRNGLSSSDNQNLKNIANNFLKEIYVLEQKLLNSKREEEILKLQNSILDLRKNLYKSIIPYIDQKSYKNYLIFIESNIKNFVEKNTIYISKLKTQNDYDKKVDILERKIQENKENLNSEIRVLIEKKLDSKISEIIDSPSFLKLSNDNKIKVIEKVIESLNSRIRNFKSNLDYDSIYIESDIQKLEIYNIMLKKLKDISYNLK